MRRHWSDGNRFQVAIGIDQTGGGLLYPEWDAWLGEVSRLMPKGLSDPVEDFVADPLASFDTLDAQNRDAGKSASALTFQ